MIIPNPHESTDDEVAAQEIPAKGAEPAMFDDLLDELRAVKQRSAREPSTGSLDFVCDKLLRIAEQLESDLQRLSLEKAEREQSHKSLRSDLKEEILAELQTSRRNLPPTAREDNSEGVSRILKLKHLDRPIRRIPGLPTVRSILSSRKHEVTPVDPDRDNVMTVGEGPTAEVTRPPMLPPVVPAPKKILDSSQLPKAKETASIKPVAKPAKNTVNSVPRLAHTHNPLPRGDVAPHADVFVDTGGIRSVLVLAGACLLSVGLFAVAFDRTRSSATITEIAREMRRANPEPAKLENAKGLQFTSPFDRQNAWRDYLVAWSKMSDTSLQSTGNKATPLPDSVHVHLKRAVERNPLLAWYRLSLALSSERSLGDAVEADLERLTIAKLAPSDPAYLLHSAGLLLRGRQTRDALVRYEHALSLEPARTADAIRTILQHGTKIDDALAVVPATPIAIALACEVLESRRMDSKPFARKLLARFEETNGLSKMQSAEAKDWRALAVTYRSVGQLEPAINAFEKALILDPKQPQWRLELGRCYYDFKQYKLADEVAQRILSELPDEMTTRDAQRLREQIAVANSGERKPIRGPLAN